MKKDTTNQLDSTNNVKTPGLFGTVGRIGIVYLIGFTLFLVTSTLMLIFLTKSSKEIKVPSVTGKQFTAVYNSLSRKGLRPEIKPYDVFDIDNGIILNQHPESGRIVTEGSSITLVVSRSGFRIDVPNLIGSELPMAINKLKHLHFNGREVTLSPGIISYIPSEKNADNIVIGQSPKPDEKITPDMKINFLVSSGTLKAGKTMPDITGQSVDLCYDLLMAKGVNIQEEIVETGDIKKSGKVISQVPAKGMAVKEGDTVKLKVYWYPLKNHPYIAYEKVEYTIGSDQARGSYEAIIEDAMSRRVRFSSKMSPGQKVRFVFHRVGNAKITILRDKNNVRVMGIDVEDFD
ncbi:MAG: PASTA domain-containing protein [bacterium]|nr:PASTA domain-containing protein [bacterium]